MGDVFELKSGLSGTGTWVKKSLLSAETGEVRENFGKVTVEVSFSM